MMYTRAEVEAQLRTFTSRRDLSLHEDVSMPRYHQMALILTHFIRESDLRVEEPFPSEEAIAKVFGVSRITANRAVQELVTMEWLVRKTGQGSFVHHPPGPILTYLSPRLSVANPDGATGDLVGRIVDARTEPARPETAKHLQINQGAQVYFVRRVLMNEDNPTMILESYLPEGLFPGLLGAPGLAGSILMVLRDRYDCVIERSDWGMEAVELLQQEYAQLLAAPVYSPALRMSGTRYDTAHRAVEDYQAYIRRGVCVRSVTYHEWTARARQ